MPKLPNGDYECDGCGKKDQPGRRPGAVRPWALGDPHSLCIWCRVEALEACLARHEIYTSPEDIPKG